MSFGNFKKSRASENLDDGLGLLDKEPKSSGAVSSIRPGSSYSVIISSGTQISGQLSFEGPAFVDAQIEGEVVAFDKLEVGPKGILKAKVKGTEVIIAGAVEGDVVASKKLVLRSGSKVYGNIQTAALVLEEGAHFEGHCVMNKESQKSSEKDSPSSSAKVTSLASSTRARSA